MKAPDISAGTLDAAYQRIQIANTAAEAAWEAYDAALQRARLAEDAVYAARSAAQDLERLAEGSNGHL
jgi:hypothetical protein